MSTTLDNLAAFIATAQADERFNQTGLKPSAFANTMMEKKKEKGGGLQNVSIRNGSQVSNSKFYLPDDTSDYVGVTASSNVFQKITPVVSGTFSWSFLAGNLMYSDVMLRQYKSAGASQLADYLGSRLQFTEGAMTTNLGAGTISGTGNGLQSTLATGGTGPTASVATDPYGIIYQNRYFSGTPNGNANSPATNTHLGLPRHLHSELVSNYFDATNHYGTAVEIAGATLTEGSTVVSVATSLDYRPYLGWEVWVDLANGTDYVPLGREYVVADAASSATTTFQLSTIYRGATDTTVAIKLVPPFNVDQHGPAGMLSTGKLDRAYYQACNGALSPDMILSNTRTFSAVKTMLKNTAQWTFVPNADYKSKGYNNQFEYEGATWCADDNMASGSIQFINTGWTRMYTLKGNGDYKIKPSDIMELPSQTGHLMYGAVKSWEFQIISESPRLNAAIVGLNT